MPNKHITTNCLSSCQDQESGLYSQRHFQFVLDQELARLDRWERPLSLVLLDLPGLTGEDWAIFGPLLLSSLRSIDLAARLEPGRVAVLLPDAHLSQTRKWLTVLLSELSRHPVLAKHNYFFGLVMARPWEDHQNKDFLALAETDLKRGGSPLNGQDENQDDLDTSIATDERNLLFHGFRALTVS